MRRIEPPCYQAAFTLLELIIVLLLVAILSAYVSARYTGSGGFEEDALVEQIISSARLTQQLSMNDSTRNFALSIQVSQIDILADGTSLTLANQNFPIVFPSDVVLGPVGNISFSSLGATAALTLTVQATETRQVCFESSGYVHAC